VISGFEIIEKENPIIARMNHVIQEIFSFIRSDSVLGVVNQKQSLLRLPTVRTYDQN
jgi:hypothetical protein